MQLEYNSYESEKILKCITFLLWDKKVWRNFWILEKYLNKKYVYTQYISEV